MKAYIQIIVGDISKEYGIEFPVEEQDDALTFLMSMIDCDIEEIQIQEGDPNLAESIANFLQGWEHRKG